MEGCIATSFADDCRWLVVASRTNPELKRRIVQARFTVCGYTVTINTEATRQLRVYLNLVSQFRAHKNRTLEKLRRAENKVRRLPAMRGLALELLKQIQVAAVRAVVSYGAEICWNGQKGWCEEYQRFINGQGRAITGIKRCAPVAVVIHEAGLEPMVILLNNRRCSYGYWLLATPATQPTRDIIPA